MGVFASRSPYRPNPIGLSVVELKGIECHGEHWLIKLGGCDLVEGTPILDIKPYLSYVDSVEGASQGWLPEAWPMLEVIFAPSVLGMLEDTEDGPRLKALVGSCLRQDPRPAYKRTSEDDREYGVLLEQWNVKFRVQEGRAEVVAMERVLG